MDYLVGKVDDFIKNICKKFIDYTKSIDGKDYPNLEKAIIFYSISKNKVESFTSNSSQKCIEFIDKYNGFTGLDGGDYSKADSEFRKINKDGDVMTIAVIISPNESVIKPTEFKNVEYYNLFIENEDIDSLLETFFLNYYNNSPIIMYSPYPKFVNEDITTESYSCKLVSNDVFNQFKLEYKFNNYGHVETKAINNLEIHLSDCNPNTDIYMKLYPINLMDIPTERKIRTLSIMKIVHNIDLNYEKLLNDFKNHRNLEPISEFKICMIGNNKYPLINGCSRIFNETNEKLAMQDPSTFDVKEYKFNINEKKNLTILNSIDLDENKDDKDQLGMIMKLVSGQLRENNVKKLNELTKDDPVHVCIMNIDIQKANKELENVLNDEKDKRPYLTFMKEKIYDVLTISSEQKEKNEYFKIKPIITINNLEKIISDEKIKKFKDDPLMLYKDKEIREIVEKIAFHFNVDIEFVFPIIMDIPKNITLLLTLYHALNSHFMIRFKAIYVCLLLKLNY